MSEIVIKSYNITQAIRFNLFINDNLYAQNVIADGVIFSTCLGSTGYFKYYFY
jgi:NAD kinase